MEIIAPIIADGPLGKNNAIINEEVRRWCYEFCAL
jgi:hypothetical protein